MHIAAVAGLSYRVHTSVLCADEMFRVPLEHLSQYTTNVLTGNTVRIREGLLENDTGYYHTRISSEESLHACLELALTPEQRGALLEAGRTYHRKWAPEMYEPGYFEYDGFTQLLAYLLGSNRRNAPTLNVVLQLRVHVDKEMLGATSVPHEYYDKLSEDGRYACVEALDQLFPLARSLDARLSHYESTHGTPTRLYTKKNAKLGFTEEDEKLSNTYLFCAYRNMRRNLSGPGGGFPMLGAQIRDIGLLPNTVTDVKILTSRVYPLGQSQSSLESKEFQSAIDIVRQLNPRTFSGRKVRNVLSHGLYKKLASPGSLSGKVQRFLIGTDSYTPAAAVIVEVADRHEAIEHTTQWPAKLFGKNKPGIAVMRMRLSSDASSSDERIVESDEFGLIPAFVHCPRNPQHPAHNLSAHGVLGLERLLGQMYAQRANKRLDASLLLLGFGDSNDPGNATFGVMDSMLCVPPLAPIRTTLHAPYPALSEFLDGVLCALHGNRRVDWVSRSDRQPQRGEEQHDWYRRPHRLADQLCNVAVTSNDGDYTSRPLVDRTRLAELLDRRFGAAIGHGCSHDMGYPPKADFVLELAELHGNTGGHPNLCTGAQVGKVLRDSLLRNSTYGLWWCVTTFSTLLSSTNNEDGGVIGSDALAVPGTDVKPEWVSVPAGAVAAALAHGAVAGLTSIGPRYTNLVLKSAVLAGLDADVSLDDRICALCMSDLPADDVGVYVCRACRADDADDRATGWDTLVTAARTLPHGSTPSVRGVASYYRDSPNLTRPTKIEVSGGFGIAHTGVNFMVLTHKGNQEFQDIWSSAAPLPALAAAALHRAHARHRNRQ